MKKASLLILLSLLSVGGAFTPRPFSKKTIVQTTQILRSTGTPASEDEDAEEGDDILRGGGITEKVDPLPTMADYRNFALPCLGLWVMGPLLSLVDTAFVGLSGDPSLSATQVAALGPATTFFDGATYLFAFLNVASTNLYSSARAQYGEDSPKTESVVRTAARVALMSGFVVMGLLFAFARPLLALYIGT
jgi:O-antigen/teichoic acid export membrane protein